MKLDSLIQKLKSKDEIDAVLLTGSQGKDNKPYSDIDLIVILKSNDQDIRKLYTWIDGKFADIFFFDHADLKRINSSKEISANSMDGVLLDWLKVATTQFDKSGKITAFKTKGKNLDNRMHILQSEKQSFTDKVSYNLVANTRYYESKDRLYHEALEVRLAYSVVETFTAYFEFRDIPWRGEKNAFKYLKSKDKTFYDLYISYTKRISLKDRFEIYVKMVERVFSDRTQLWKKGDIIPQLKNDKNKPSRTHLIEYWKKLIN